MYSIGLLFSRKDAKIKDLVQRRFIKVMGILVPEERLEDKA